MNLVALCRSRMGLGALVVVFGAVGTFAAARVVREDPEDARRAQSGPLVASAVPVFAPVPLQRRCPSSARADYFFPRGTFSTLPVDPTRAPDHPADDMHREYVARYLETTKEPPLWCGSPGVAESYRFLLLPSLRGEAACVRIERNGAEIHLIAALLSTTGGAILESTDKKLKKADWDDLLARLNATHFWESLASEESRGVDGEAWIVEGRRDGAYKAVDRANPDPDDAFGRLGMRFLELARMTTAAQ